MTVKLSVFLIIFLCLIPASGVADQTTPEQAKGFFYQGNSAYTAGDYHRAIENYEQVLSAGYESGPVYYNLGNAYFKTGAVGKALANYYRAQYCMGADADLQSNLAFADAQRKGEGSAVTGGLLQKLFTVYANRMSADGVTARAIIYYWLLTTALSIFIVVKRYRKIVGGITLLCGLAFTVYAGAFALQFSELQVRRIVIVTDKDVPCRFEPVDDATTFFTLAEGDRVTLVATQGNWAKVKRADAKQGWVPKEVIEPLVVVQGKAR